MTQHVCPPLRGRNPSGQRGQVPAACFQDTWPSRGKRKVCDVWSGQVLSWSLQRDFPGPGRWIALTVTQNLNPKRTVMTVQAGRQRDRERQRGTSGHGRHLPGTLRTCSPAPMVRANALQTEAIQTQPWTPAANLAHTSRGVPLNLPSSTYHKPSR